MSESTSEAPPSNGETTVVREPFLQPTNTSKPPAPPTLTPDQITKYAAVLSTVSSWTTVPDSTSNKTNPSSPITDSERQWLPPECILRYLRATKWSVPDASKRLLSTLSWRREYGVNNFTADYISPEQETGKQVLCGYDIAARPCLMLNPGNQNTKPGERQIHHLVYMLEKTIDLMGPGQETLSLLINFGQTRSGSGPSLGQGKTVMSILQNHYPERLGRALVMNVPWFFWGFFKLITPFIDPATREKLKFNEDMRQHVPPEQLIKSYQGDVEFQYDHSIYWPSLNKLADQKTKLMEENWIKGGKRVGEYEAYLKGGEGAKSLAELEGTKDVEKEVDGIADGVEKATIEEPPLVAVNGQA